MACGSCGKKRRSISRDTVEKDLMGGYKYLTDRQIKARLEAFKKRFCANCSSRYECDYTMYLKCKNRLT
jgi:hypothetical protein